MIADKVIINLDNLSHSYGQIPSVQHISYSFLKGSLTAIFGPNGGGKSTLLKIIAGLIPVQSGKRESFLSHPSELAYLPQDKNIDPTFPLQVEDVVAMGLWPRMGIVGGLALKDRLYIQEALAQVGLIGFNKRRLTELSGGQLQRLLFARLIAQQAHTILLDEPFTGLDAPTTQDLLNLLQKWHCQGKTIIVVLHDIEMIKKFFPDCLLISHQLIAAGKSEIVLRGENLAKAAFYV